MTNIIEKTLRSDVHLHIDKAFEIIQGNLPNGYAEKVLLKIQNDSSLTLGVVRNTKNRIPLYPVKRINVINALVEIAQEYIKEKEALRKLVV